MKSFILAALVLVSSSAFAATVGSDHSGTNMLGKTYVGVQAGFMKPNTTPSTDGGFAYGAVAGYGFMDNITGGVYFDRYSKSVLGTDLSFNSFGVEGNYHLMDLPGLSAGVKVGLVNTSSSIGSVSNSSSKFAIGPKVMYDHPIGNNLTVGGEANYLIASDINPFSILGQIKYWF